MPCRRSGGRPPDRPWRRSRAAPCCWARPGCCRSAAKPSSRRSRRPRRPWLRRRARRRSRHCLRHPARLSLHRAPRPAQWSLPGPNPRSRPGRDRLHPPPQRGSRPRRRRPARRHSGLRRAQGPGGPARISAAVRPWRPARYGRARRRVPAASRSSIVQTASTPGATRADSVSIDRIFARAWGERTTAPCRAPGKFMSSMYLPRPVRNRRSSRRGAG